METLITDFHNRIQKVIIGIGQCLDLLGDLLYDVGRKVPRSVATKQSSIHYEWNDVILPEDDVTFPSSRWNTRR